MIFETPSLPLPLKLKADLCVIGSGPGGMMVAMTAAEAGMRVVVLEAGEFLMPSSMSQREEQMLPRLFWDSGARMTSDRGVKIHQGKGVGGSSLHNLNLCKRIPAPIIDQWQRGGQREVLTPALWRGLYDEVEQLLTVREIPEGLRNYHNRLLKKGCDTLGWRGGVLSHNRTGCAGSGFCELGCAFDSKNNAAKVLLPRAIAAGTEVFAGCQAIALRHEAGKITGVRAAAVRSVSHTAVGSVEVDAPSVCVSASATATAALLLRSSIPDASGTVGQGLRVHPAVVAAGQFDESVVAWHGTPQSYECTEFLRFDDPKGSRVWILPAFAHPMGVATMLPGHGQSHADMMALLPHLAVFSAMLHDHTAGRVAPDGDFGLTLDYWPDAEDRRQLSQGLWACVHLLFAAGARRAWVPMFPKPVIVERGEDYDWLRSFDFSRGALDLTAVHPMSTVPMDDDPSRGAVNCWGCAHGVRGLWVADGSLFPTSIGVPPQISIYALGLHVGRAIVAAA